MLAGRCDAPRPVVPAVWLGRPARLLRATLAPRRCRRVRPFSCCPRPIPCHGRRGPTAGRRTEGWRRDHVRAALQSLRCATGDSPARVAASRPEPLLQPRRAARRRCSAAVGARRVSGRLVPASPDKTARRDAVRAHVAVVGRGDRRAGTGQVRGPCSCPGCMRCDVGGPRGLPRLPALGRGAARAAPGGRLRPSTWSRARPVAVDEVMAREDLRRGVRGEEIRVGER